VCLHVGSSRCYLYNRRWIVTWKCACLRRKICNKAAFVSINKADANVSLARRDAYLKTFHLQPSVQQNSGLRLSFSPYLFAGNDVRIVCPALTGVFNPTVQVTCEIPASGLVRTTPARAPRARTASSNAHQVRLQDDGLRSTALGCRAGKSSLCSRGLF